MSSIRFELNSDGVRELLQSSEMQSALGSIASDIQLRCGDGYNTDVVVMNTRAIASVYADSQEAMNDNLENNTLLKAL